MYAGFWKRLAAFIIDNIIAYVLLMIVMAFIGYSDKLSNPATVVSAVLVMTACSMLIYALYWALFESSSLQATPGKMALGIKVTDMNGNRISFGRALGRNLGKIISGFTLNIGYVMAGFTVRKQALHDKMADCLVIDKNADTQNLQPLPKASGTLVFFAILGALSPFIIYIVAMSFMFMAFFKMAGIPSIPTSGASLSERGVEELKANMPEFPEQSYEVVNYKLALGENYITASAEEKDGIPAHTLTRCYAKDRTCIYAHVFSFIKEVDLPYSQPEMCCL